MQDLHRGKTDGSATCAESSFQGRLAGAIMSEEPKEAEPTPAGRAIEAQAEIIEEAIGMLSSVVNRWHHSVDVTLADWSDVARFARVADAATKLVKKIQEEGQS